MDLHVSHVLQRTHWITISGIVLLLFSKHGACKVEENQDTGKLLTIKHLRDCLCSVKCVFSNQKINLSVKDLRRVFNVNTSNDWLETVSWACPSQFDWQVIRLAAAVRLHLLSFEFRRRERLVCLHTNHTWLTEVAAAAS